MEIGGGLDEIYMYFIVPKKICCGLKVPNTTATTVGQYT